MSVIKIENVSVEFVGEKVLQEINLQMESKKIYGLIGRNGSGKSVLLRHAHNALDFYGYVLHCPRLKQKVNALIIRNRFLCLLTLVSIRKPFAPSRRKNVLHRIDRSRTELRTRKRTVTAVCAFAVVIEHHFYVDGPGTPDQNTF